MNLNVPICAAAIVAAVILAVIPHQITANVNVNLADQQMRAELGAAFANVLGRIKKLEASEPVKPTATPEPEKKVKK